MLRTPTQSKPPIDVKSDLQEEFYQKFYAENASREISTKDIEDFEKNALAEGKDKNQVNIAKMLLYADIVSSRKQSKGGEQITFFTGPLIGMFAEAEKKDADPNFKAAADIIRKDQHVQSTILRVHSNSLNELATKMQYYHNHFSKMKTDFKKNKAKILKENPKLAENNNKMYKKTEKALEDLSKIYDNKMKSLKKEERTLYNKILKKEPLTAKEYADGLELTTKLASFQNNNVPALVEVMSIYQAFVSIDAFKTSKDRSAPQLQMNVYSELFQAPMRHPMMMEQVIKDAKKIQISTTSGSTKAIDSQIISDVSNKLNETTKAVSDSNFNFGNNFMLDTSTAKNLITLNNILLEDTDNKFNVAPETKSLVSNYANAMNKFIEANYNYYIDPSLSNKQKFGMAYINLNTMFSQMSKPENVAKLMALDSNPLNDAFFPITRKEVKEAIPRIIDETKQGLLIFLRATDFNTFKTKNLIELKVEHQAIKDTLSKIDNNLLVKENAIKQLLSKLDDEMKSLNVDVNDDNSSKMIWVEKLAQTMETLSELKTQAQKLKGENNEQLKEDQLPPTPVQSEQAVPPPTPPITIPSISIPPRIDPDISRTRSYKPHIPPLDLSKLRKLEHEQQERQEEAHVEMSNNDDDKMGNTSTVEAHDESHNDDVVVAQDTVLDTAHDRPDVHEQREFEEEEKHTENKKQESKAPVPSVQSPKETQPPPVSRVQASVALFKALIDEQAKQRQIEQAQRTKQRSDTTPVAPNTKLKS